MANTDKESTVSPQTSGKEGHGPAAEFFSGEGEEAGVKGADDAVKNVVASEVSKSTPAVSTETKPAITRPSLVQLGSGSTQTSTTTQPKRFSAVNINKKFLEKNSSGSASSPISQPAVKAGGPAPRPPTQSSASHSRLVTAKLTSTSPASSTSGAGWSRPSSAAPPNATGSHSPNNGSPPLPATSLGTTSSSAGAPQLPHAGKVIQPQPRAAIVSSGLSQKDSVGAASNKTVWGNVKPTAAHKMPDVRNEFPTAAEVAQVASSLRTAKLNDSREAAESAAASKQARMEEADTFRGVHLNPNAHHWDEMEEDDDNFLERVIEFGDGRQYKIEPADEPSADSSLTATDPNSSTEPHSVSKSRLDNILPSKDLGPPNLPVSKEERFADDFDRSWPRSRTSPAILRDVPLPSSHSGPSNLPPASPALSPDMQFQQEASRVLFNERSNRLEPYSNTPRSGSGQYTSKRGSWQESSSSPTELRNARDIPSHSHNIQLLQKPGTAEPQSRFRRFSGTSSSGGFGPGPSGAYNRDQLPRRDGPPASPRMSKDNFNLPGRDRESHERGRRSDMGPPSLPAHAMRGLSRDSVRQLPPHLSQIPASVPVAQGRRTSRDSRFGPPTPGDSSVPNSARLPSQSPVFSHTSAARISPAVSITPLPNLTAPELDEARKDVMQSAAARAKQRRQQEEEEREKEKERARRKAAELEERIKAAETEKAKAQEKLEAENLAKRQQEDEAIAVIEDAVKSVQLPKDPSDPRSARPNLRRPPSLKGLPTSDSAKTPVLQRQTLPTSTSVPSLTSAPTPAVQAESWRSKASPMLLIPIPQVRPSLPSFVPPAHDHVESLVPEEDLEVVDFQDMGKFVGVPDVPKSAKVEKQPGGFNAHPSSRPVASDFFDEPSRPGPPVSSTVAEEAWRQSLPQYAQHEQVVSLHREVEAKTSPKKDQSRNIIVADASRPSDVASNLPTKASSNSTDHVQTVVLSPQTSAVRTPRNQSFYKEAAMSALDDAMSRIKGALDGMQAGEAAKEGLPLAPSDSDLSMSKNGQVTTFGRSNSQKERWVPPALRLRNFECEPREVFHVTCSEPPRSPKPAWNAFVVRLPSISQHLDPINKRQLQLATKPSYQVRLDILSFDPPVEGMNRRDLSVNDVLFRKSIGGFRTKLKYRVMLPRFRPGPRVNLPAHPLPSKANGVGAFGRPAGADGVTTWRKPAQPKQASDDAIDNELGLTTTSRSPPPDTMASGSSVTSIPVSDSSTSTKLDGATARPRVPKMPAGSAVAFYRDSRIDAVEEDPKPSVNFIVGSELESRQASQATTPSKPQPNITVTSPIAPTTSLDSARHVKPTLTNGVKESLTTVNASSLVLSKADSKSSDDSVDRVPLTPPTHHTASWARTSLAIPLKESPARGPDPEHLKAVWSQTSNKAGSHGVNSLEGIADDLTALPFTLQDVKSEDGETPPPSVSAPPSRMSLHDVTRAFQQVPPSSSSNPSPSHRTSPLTAPPARPPSYAYGLPPPPTGTMRPGYPYQSPVMSHSPSPGLMYPQMLSASPAPGRIPVNGHASLYGPPMWMPMQAGSTPQNHANMMRPMGSPYPPLMPYSPGPPPMYGHQSPASMQNPPQQQNGVQGNRDRNVSMMSPVMAHAGPAMYGSPVLMHAPVMPLPVPPNHGYMVPAGRGQTRTDNGQIPIQNSQQPNHHNQPHSGYNPSSSFVRPTW